MSGRKIDIKYQNPIDNVLIDIAESLNPIFKDIGFNANGITMISILFKILFLYCLHKKLYMYSIIYYIIQYFFDTMDGNFARKYNQTSDFGDKLDHISDSLTIIFAVIIIIKNKNIIFKNKIIIFIINIIFLIIMNIQLGCQEKIYNSNSNKESMLTSLEFLCKDKNKLLPITKYFGSGTYTMIICLSILYIKTIDK